MWPLGDISDPNHNSQKGFSAFSSIKKKSQDRFHVTPCVIFNNNSYSFTDIGKKFNKVYEDESFQYFLPFM
jgi:hypothetical protein